MALSILNSNQNAAFSGSSVAVTLNNATGAGNLLVAVVACLSTTPSNVTDGTSTFTQFPSARVSWTGTFAGVVTDWYYLASSNSGKTTITFNAAGSSGFLEIQVWEVHGFTSPTTDGTVNNGTGGTANGAGVATCIGPAFTPTTATGFAAAMCGPNAGPISGNPAGNNFTDGINNPSGDGFCAKIEASTSAITPEWTDSTTGDSFISSVVGFKESGGGGGETITIDKWFREAVTVLRRKVGIVPSGTIGIKP